MSAEQKPSAVLSRRRKRIFAVVVMIAAVAGVELALRVTLGNPQQRERYRWLVDTHFVDMSFAEFQAREADLAVVRARLGMERGRSHPIFGFTYNPGFEAHTAVVDLSINSLGFRSPEFPLEKPPGETRVLCLGGSTTAGEEVRDAETYPAVLERMLHERLPDRQIRVVNVAIPSYDVERSLRHFELRLHNLGADYVTIYHGINDVLRHPEGGVAVTRVPNYTGRDLDPFVFQGDGRGPSLRAIPGRALDWLATWSHLGKMLSHVVDGLTHAPPTLTQPDPAALNTFRERYEALLRAIECDGATPLPMTFSLAYPGDFTDAERKKAQASLAIWTGQFATSPDVGRAIVDAQNKIVEELCERHGLPLTDVARAVPPDARHFVDCCHLTAAGNERVAAALADTLTPAIGSH